MSLSLDISIKFVGSSSKLAISKRNEYKTTTINKRDKIGT